jgi:hypothetical protein
MADPVQNKARKARLAQALRANLKKRRAQSRSRDPQELGEASEPALEAQPEPASLFSQRKRTSLDES